MTARPGGLVRHADAIQTDQADVSTVFVLAKFKHSASTYTALGAFESVIFATMEVSHRNPRPVPGRSGPRSKLAT